MALVAALTPRFLFLRGRRADLFDSPVRGGAVRVCDAGLNALKHLESTAPPAAAKDGDGGEGSLFTCTVSV